MLTDNQPTAGEGLVEKDFGKDQLTEMQKIIDAEKSDLFDVLAYVAFALAPLSREERATNHGSSLPSTSPTSYRPSSILCLPIMFR
jgi:hypothetical protein